MKKIILVFFVSVFILPALPIQLIGQDVTDDSEEESYTEIILPGTTSSSPDDEINNVDEDEGVVTEKGKRMAALTTSSASSALSVLKAAELSEQVAEQRIAQAEEREATVKKKLLETESQLKKLVNPAPSPKSYVYVYIRADEDVVLYGIKKGKRIKLAEITSGRVLPIDYSMFDRVTLQLAVIKGPFAKVIKTKEERFENGSWVWVYEGPEKDPIKTRDLVVLPKRKKG